MSLVEFFYYFVNKIFHKKNEKKYFTESPPAKKKFKAISIDKLNNWTRQKLEKETKSKSYGNYCNRNDPYLQELHLFKAKTNLKEEFINNFLKSYK